MCGYLIQEYPKWIDQKGKIPQGMVNPLQQLSSPSQQQDIYTYGGFNHGLARQLQNRVIRSWIDERIPC